MASATTMCGTVPTVASACLRTSRAVSVDDDAVCDQGEEVVATNKTPTRSLKAHWLSSRPAMAVDATYTADGPVVENACTSVVRSPARRSSAVVVTYTLLVDA